MRDFDYYIKAASEAKNRSSLMWKMANAYIVGVLEKCKREKKTLQEAAAILKKSAGRQKGTWVLTKHGLNG